MKMRLQIRKISCEALIGWVLIGIALVMLGNSIRLCFSRDIWYDELFTVGMIEHSYGELLHFTAQDVHPPLYYCITKGIVDLCKLIDWRVDTIIAAKLASIVPYFLLLVYALTFLRNKFDIFTAGLFMFCIMSMPQLSAYTVEMRMYSWALFFVTAAFFHAYGIICGDKHPVRHDTALTLYGLAAAYTQYFACVAVIMIYLSLLAWFVIRYRTGQRKVFIKRWIICVILSIIGYLPWLFVLFSQIKTVRANYWILPLTWRSLGGCVKFLMKPAFWKEEINAALAVILFVMYLVLLAGRGCQVYKAYKEYKACKEYKTWQQDDDITKKLEKFLYAAAGCMVLCGLVGFGFLASVMIRPIFVYRYMIPAMGCFWLCFILNIDAPAGRECAGGENAQHEEASKQDKLSKQGKVSYNKKLTFAFSLILLLVVGLRDYRAFMGEEEYKIVLMKETEQAFCDIAPEDMIVYNFNQLQAVTRYYLSPPQESYLWGSEPEPLIEEMFGRMAVVENTAQIKEWLAAGKKVWFFGSFNSREDIRTQWEADGLITKECGSYMLERYWFNVYEISE